MISVAPLQIDISNPDFLIPLYHVPLPATHPQGPLSFIFRHSNESLEKYEGHSLSNRFEGRCTMTFSERSLSSYPTTLTPSEYTGHFLFISRRFDWIYYLLGYEYI